MSRDIQTQIDIDASPEVVWDIVTSLESYADWNPLITSSSGVVEVGEKLTNRFQPLEGKARTFTVEVTVVDPVRVFEWVGRFPGIPALLEGRHRFELEATPEGTRLKHSEVFSGLAAALIMRESVRAKTEAGFRALDEALKTRAEAETTSGST